MDITSSVPLTFQGDASRGEKCTLTNGDVVFRKAGNASAIQREVVELQHLMNSSRILLTPQLLGFGDDWMVTSWLPGSNLAQQFAGTESDANRGKICERFGSVLCASSAISSSLSEADDTFEDAFEAIDRIVQANSRRVITDLDAYINGRTVGDVWREVMAEGAEVVPEIRYMQGDWCLPNVLTGGPDASQLGGIVDWSEAGWMDWRFCIADGLWSIGFNSRLAGCAPEPFQRMFLDVCDVDPTGDVLVWCRKLRALQALI
jgi:aminoglycoside phosphotransferase